MCFLEWKDIQFKLIKGNKQILHRQSGRLQHGQMCCVLGPSGSGKTSLLNILSGRITSNNKYLITGQIWYNGVKMRHLKNDIAYVMQQDALSLYLSVYESLHLALSLRGGTTDHSKKKKKIESIISLLDLQKSKDTLYINLSGGEKKRLAIGIETINNPKIIFLDEPTSGLDSYTALKIIENMNTIKKQEQCVILVVIHQPSSEIFYLFDQLLLIKEGYSIYQDKIENIHPFLEKLHFPIPLGHNPADFILLKLQTTQLDYLISKQDLSNRPSITDRISLRISYFSPVQSRQSSFCQQLYLLSHREYLNTIRDRGAIIARFGIAILLNLLFALIFKGSGTSNDIITHLGSIVQIAISAMFSSTQPTLLAFPIERPIFIREYLSGSYHILPYFLSKLIIELPLTFLLNVATILIRFWIMELQGDIMVYIAVIWLLGLVSSSIALFLGSITKDIKVALETSPLIFVPQIMFAGFFIKIKQIPIYLRWAQYLCSLKFTINILMITEFEYCLGKDPECDLLFQQNDVHPDLLWLYVVILIGLFVFFRVMSLISLARLSQSF